MSIVTDINFILGKICDEPQVLALLGQALGFAVESIDHLNDLAPGYAQVAVFEEGDCPQSFYVSWPESLEPKCSGREAAAFLAGVLDVRVLLDLPGLGDTSWMQVMPNGHSKLVTVEYLDEGLRITDKEG